MSTVKYKTAYDSKKKCWVIPDEIDKCERYDKPRYYSININEDSTDTGEILTYRKETKEIKFKRPELHPDETGFIRKACFVTLCKNTREHRERLNEQVQHQESSVHKLAKQVAKDIKYIKVPSINIDILGVNYELVPEQVIEVNYVNSEKKDEQINRIPDLIFDANINGIKQKLYVEIFYKHAVDQYKREELRKEKINCIEVDISELRENLDLTEKAISKKIRDSIEHNAYWISNRYNELFIEEMSKIFVEINTSNILNATTFSNISSGHEFYMFRDMYRSFTGQDCISNDTRCINIGDCRKCRKCLLIKDSNNNNEVKIYCLVIGTKAPQANTILKIINHIKKSIKKTETEIC